MSMPYGNKKTAPAAAAAGGAEEPSAEKNSTHRSECCIFAAFDQRLENWGARRAALRPYSRDLLPEAMVFTCFFGVLPISSLSD